MILTDSLALPEGHLGHAVTLVRADRVEEVKQDALTVCAAEKSLSIFNIDKISS